MIYIQKKNYPIIIVRYLRENVYVETLSRDADHDDWWIVLIEFAAWWLSTRRKWFVFFFFFFFEPLDVYVCLSMEELLEIREYRETFSRFFCLWFLKSNKEIHFCVTNRKTCFVAHVRRISPFFLTEFIFLPMFIFHGFVIIFEFVSPASRVRSHFGFSFFFFFFFTLTWRLVVVVCVSFLPCFDLKVWVDARITNRTASLAFTARSRATAEINVDGVTSQKQQQQQSWPQPI